MMPMDPLVLPSTRPASGAPEVDASGWNVCARHGQPVRRRVDMAVKWTPAPPGAGQALPVQFGKRLARNPNLDVAQRLGETVLIHTPGWPLCAHCARFRTRWMALALLLLGAGVLALAAAVTTWLAVGRQAWLMAPLLGGFVLVLLAVVPFAHGSLPRLTGTRGTPDGSAVLVDHAHPVFRAAVR